MLRVILALTKRTCIRVEASLNLNPLVRLLLNSSMLI